MQSNEECNPIEQIVDNPLVADPYAHYTILIVYSDILEPQVIGDVLVPI